jgi:predicted transcriptional regulator YdeE
MHNVEMTIWTKWLPESGYEAVDAPYLEYYGEEFDGRWLPNLDTDQGIIALLGPSAL